MTFKPSTYIFGIIIFVFMIVGGISMVSMVTSDMPSFNNNDELTEFNNTFNKMNDVTTRVEQLEDNIADADVDFGVFGVLNALISSGWQTLRLLFSSFGFFEDVLTGLTTFFGVPAWIPALIILMITVGIGFAIYSAIFQKEV